MNLVNNTQTSPSFGNIIVAKGANDGRKVVEKLVRSGYSAGDRLAEIFRNNEKNFAADILISSDKIAVRNKITGEEFIPTGNILSSVKNANGSHIKEIELAQNSSRQPELTDSFALQERNFLGTKTERVGFLNYSVVDNYFQRKSPNSYIVEHSQNSATIPETYLYRNVDEPEKLVSQFNACLDIAKDIYAKAYERMSEGCQNTLNAFIDHLIK